MSNEIPKVRTDAMRSTVFDELVRPGEVRHPLDKAGRGKCSRTLPVGNPDYEGVDKEESYD